MRKTTLLFLALLGLLPALCALPRELVVVEVVTGTWCQYCPGAAMACHDLLQNGHPVAVIKNHTGDAFTNQYSEARNNFYNPTGVPTAWFDGLNPSSGGSATQSLYTTYLPRVTARLGVPSHFTISAQGTQEGPQVQLSVTVTKLEADSNTNVKLHAVLTESNIAFPWQNQTTLENVNRLMLPDQNGTDINLSTGGSTTINLSFTPNPAWQLANCELIFFLQNMNSKEILQAVKYPLADLAGYYPLSTNTLDFPDTYLSGAATLPLTITNYLDTPVSGTITSDNPVFTCSVTNFSIPGSSSLTATVTFTPAAVQTYAGNLTVSSNLHNHPNLSVTLSGTGYSNLAPTVENLQVTGPPVLYQQQFASYDFIDADGDAEGNTAYQWYRFVNDIPQAIANANEVVYRAVNEDLGYPIAIQVTPVDENGMAGMPVMSPPTLPIEVLPPPQNLQGTCIPPDTVQLSWETPQHFGLRGLAGYRIYRDSNSISSLSDPGILSFSDTGVSLGTHEYWVRSVFDDPPMLSGPSNTVSVMVSVATDDQLAPVEVGVRVSPNPFHGGTGISIKSEAGARVEFAIYNIRGQLVKNVNLTADNAGKAGFTWDGTDAQGSPVNSGVYQYRMSSAGRFRTGRVVLIR